MRVDLPRSVSAIATLRAACLVLASSIVPPALLAPVNAQPSTQRPIGHSAASATAPAQSSSPVAAAKVPAPHVQDSTHATAPAGTSPKPSDAPATPSTDSIAQKLRREDLNCPDVYPPPAQTPEGTETPHGTLSILPATRWQPVNGEVFFRLSGMEKPPENVTVFFAWQKTPRIRLPVAGAKPVPDGDFCRQSLRVRLMPRTISDDDTTFTYVARVPKLSDDAAGFPHLSGWQRVDWGGTLPLADMFVHGTVTTDKVSVNFVLTDTIGISTTWFALATSAALCAIAWGILNLWAKWRHVPGGILLAVISTPSGVASLSQFQICLWTFVIGAGVVYVMVLTGSLIDIPIATLGLLGISGFALVGSKLQANADGVAKTGGCAGCHYWAQRGREPHVQHCRSNMDSTAELGGSFHLHRPLPQGR